MSTGRVVIIGSGFAATILARLLASRGLRVTVVEKGRHPRFALGESSTPLASICLERLAAEYDLPDLAALAAYGRWSRDLPHLGRGLKRGFTFYAHRHGRRFANDDANSARMLVAASPADELADAHWLRSDVDHHLVRRAADEGIEIIEECEIAAARPTAGGWRLEGSRRGGALALDAGFVVDGSGGGDLFAGPRGPAGAGSWRGTRAGVGPARGDRAHGWTGGHGGDQPPVRADPSRPDTGLVFGHFEGVGSFVSAAEAHGARFPAGPYPDERAAVHHLLDEGWAYVLPFDDGRVSAGFVLDRTNTVARRWLASGPAAAWEACVAAYPSLADQFAGSRPVRPVGLIPRLQRRAPAAGGNGWAALPHTYFFASPLFSTGIAWSLTAVGRLARALALDHEPARETALAEHGALLETEADAIAALTGPAYRFMSRFDAFCAWAHMYFATASFHEAWQRLADPPSPGGWTGVGFLGACDPAARSALGAARMSLDASVAAGDSGDLEPALAAALAPRNVAGLADPIRHRLYPVDLDALVERHALFGLTRAEIIARLPRLRSPEPAAAASVSGVERRVSG